MAYGCFNRGPFKKDYITTWGEVLPFLMLRECQYQKDDKYADPGCVGCKHKVSLSGNSSDLLKGTQSADPKQRTKDVD